ncbi:serpin family protein [uncultured Bacteroides sp.]|uniref:serpin family protein n=1 Tax=uncultured Bacteroides sp. TaxID=162156 RepID=UPI00341B7B91
MVTEKQPEREKLCRVDMSIPKFDIKADLQLKDALMVMGMHRAFDIEADGFRDMADVRFFISSFQW